MGPHNERPQHIPRQRNVKQLALAAQERRNRRLLAGAKIAGEVAAALAVTAIVGYAALHDRYIPTQSPNIPPITGTLLPGIERFPLSNTDVVAQEAAKLILPQETIAKERTLWTTYGYEKSSVRLPINEQTVNEARQRVQRSFNLMKDSENPYLKEAFRYFSALIDKDEAIIEVYNQLPPPYTIEDGMVTGFQDRNGKLVALIAVNANEPLNNAVAETIAIELAHEIEHVRNALAYQTTLPRETSIDERRIKERQRMANPQEQIAEEARGYGIQSNTFIYQYALGYRGGVGNTHEEEAAIFIQTGQNPTSSQWKEYIKSIIPVGTP